MSLGTVVILIIPDRGEVVVLVEPLQEHAQHGDLPHIAVPGLGGGAGVPILHHIPCFASRMLSLAVDSFAFVSFSSTPLGLHNSTKAPVLVGAHVLSYLGLGVETNLTKITLEAGDLTIGC